MKTKICFIMGAVFAGIVIFFGVIKPIKDNLTIINVTYEIEGERKFNHKPYYFSEDEDEKHFYFIRLNEQGYTIAFLGKNHFYNCQECFEIDGKTVDFTTVFHLDNNVSSSTELISVCYNMYYDSNGELQCVVEGKGARKICIRKDEQYNNNYEDFCCSLYK